jgi:hypothetical protein
MFTADNNARQNVQEVCTDAGAPKAPAPLLLIAPISPAAEREPASAPSKAKTLSG